MRFDHKIINQIIPDNKSVIDIGCSKGQLLETLAKKKNMKLHGIEIDSKKVSENLKKGLSVIQGDADEDLQYYQKNSFDYAVLCLTLQAMEKPKEVLEESLRIAKSSIIVIPNFGHIQNRLYFCLKGQMPVTKNLSYEWYETPNIHFCTIKDMISLLKKIECKINQRICIKNKSYSEFKGLGNFSTNLFGKYGLFVISKK